MIARCQDGDFQLTIELVAPMNGTATTVSYTFDEGEARTHLWALGRGGEAVLARFPAPFARDILTAREMGMTISDGQTPQQRYVLVTPRDPEVLGGVLSACGEPLTSTAPPPGRLLTSPEWLERPSGSMIMMRYPRRAADRGINGAATIQCIVTAEGRPEACLPVAETPQGEGFAEATTAVARGFRMRPSLADGSPVEGSVVNITLRWFIH